MKPVVLYNRDAYCRIVLDEGAVVYPINHPSPLVSNEGRAYTSRVLRKRGRVFETHNTIYLGVSGKVAESLSSFANPTTSAQR